VDFGGGAKVGGIKADDGDGEDELKEAGDKAELEGWDAARVLIGAIS